MSRVAIVFTGGTISMVRDAAAGGNVPALDGAALLALTPGLDTVADVVSIDLGRMPASHFTLARLLEIGGEIRRAQEDPAIDGVVVIQGTDSIEETAFLWDLVLEGPEPVIVTGAMRTSAEDGYDGPRNIRNAVRAAAAPELRGSGVTVCLAGTIEPADSVIKTHSAAFETFRSLEVPPLGAVDEDGVRLARRRGPRRHVATDRAVEEVALVTTTVGMDGRPIDDAARWARGIVVAASGAGNTTASALEAGARAMEQGIEVVLTTRCPSGEATTAYGFPGGGAAWVGAGALLAGHLGGPKARVALACGLGAELDHAGLRALLADPAPAGIA